MEAPPDIEMPDEPHINGDQKAADEKPSTAAGATEEELSYLAKMPTEVLRRIFCTLNLKERVRMSKVCWRWYHILTDGKTPMEGVSVVNIFQKSDNKKNMRNHHGEIPAMHIQTPGQLLSILSHVNKVSSLKLWYSDKTFIEEIIPIIKETGMKMKNIDVYPYSEALVMDVLYKHMPRIGSITMRPHGADFYWKGLDLGPIPPFRHITTLVLESFRLDANTVFPPSLTSLEFSYREDRNLAGQPPQLSFLIPKLCSIPNLEYLCLSYAEVSKEMALQLLKMLSSEYLPKISFLVFKFCKLHAFSLINPSELPTINLSLQMLKLDLCYGRMLDVCKIFIEVASKICLVGVNIVTDKESMTDINQIAPLLEYKKIWLHLGLMAKEPPAAQRPDVETIPFSATVYKVVSRMELSFLNTSNYIDMLKASAWPILHDIRLIQCEAATDEFLSHIAKTSLLLRKMTVISCKGLTVDCMRTFAEVLPRRQAKNITVIWKLNRVLQSPSHFFLVMAKNLDSYPNTAVRFFGSVFSGAQRRDEGEEVVIWHKPTDKTFRLKDFSDQDTEQVISLFLPWEDADEPSTSAVRNSIQVGACVTIHKEEEFMDAPVAVLQARRQMNARQIGSMNLVEPANPPPPPAPDNPPPLD